MPNTRFLIFQDEYQKIQERRELEDNYINFKAVLGSKSPTKPVPGNGSTHDDDDDEEELDESNPFFEDKLDLSGLNPFSGDDDDDYDESGKNPFS